MNCIRKARGTTIAGLVVGLGLFGSAAPVGYHAFAQQRAEERFNLIVRNLTAIDVAVSQWAKDHPTGRPDRLALVGANGSGQYVAWPTGPVAGQYALSGGGEDRRATASAAIPLCATFDGGTKGAMNRAEWLQTCSTNPGSCGL